MHLCTVCDALCSCNGDTGGVIHHDPVPSCSHCALCCAHGYRLEGPCQFCDVDHDKVGEASSDHPLPSSNPPA